VVDESVELLGRDDLADRLLDGGELRGVLFDASADLGTHVHEDLAGIDLREEVTAEHRRQRERGDDKSHDADDGGRSVREGEGEQLAIAKTQAFEAPLESALEPYQRIA